MSPRRQRPSLIACAAFAACAPEATAPPDLGGQSLFLALIDAASAPHLSVYGCEQDTTPYLRSLADDAVLFEDVSAAAPYTLASVTTILTGLAPDRHRVLIAGDLLPEWMPLLFEDFAATGAHTFAVSTNAHIHPRFGFDRGVESFSWIDPRVGETPYHEVPEEVFDAVAAELSREGREPFCAYVHLMPPHAPYDPPPDLRRRYAPDEPDATRGSLEFLAPLTVGARRADDAEREAVVALYRASVAYADRCLERLDRLLEAAGRADEALFVVVSDHGEAFGERGHFQHSALVLETMLRVPLLMRFPGRFGAGRRIGAPVSLVDLAPTLRALFGVGEAVSASWLPLLAGDALEANVGETIVARTAGPGPYTSLRSGTDKLVWSSQAKRWELFDLSDDFFEQRDLSAERPRRLQELQQELAAFWAYNRPSAVQNARIALDDDMIARLRAIGYLHEPSQDPLPEDPLPEDP